MSPSSSACPNHFTKTSRFRRIFQNAAIAARTKRFKLWRKPKLILRKHLQHNQLPSIPCAFIQTIFSSINWPNWRWFYHQHPIILFFWTKIICWTHFMNRIIQKLKRSRLKSILSSIEPGWINHLKLKVPETIISQPLMDISVILKTSHTDLQLTIPQWKLVLMIISLQKMTRCKSIMHRLFIFLLTLQLFVVKILLLWCLVLFMIQFQPKFFPHKVAFTTKK